MKFAKQLRTNAARQQALQLIASYEQQLVHFQHTAESRNRIQSQIDALKKAIADI